MCWDRVCWASTGSPSGCAYRLHFLTLTTTANLLVLDLSIPPYSPPSSPIFLFLSAVAAVVAFPLFTETSRDDPASLDRTDHFLPQYQPDGPPRGWLYCVLPFLFTCPTHPSCFSFLFLSVLVVRYSSHRGRFPSSQRTWPALCSTIRSLQQQQLRPTLLYLPVYKSQSSSSTALWLISRHRVPCHLFNSNRHDTIQYIIQYKNLRKDRPDTIVSQLLPDSFLFFCSFSRRVLVHIALTEHAHPPACTSFARTKPSRTTSCSRAAVQPCSRAVLQSSHLEAESTSYIVQHCVRIRLLAYQLLQPDSTTINNTTHQRNQRDAYRPYIPVDSARRSKLSSDLCLLLLPPLTSILVLSHPSFAPKFGGREKKFGFVRARRQGLLVSRESRDLDSCEGKTGCIRRTGEPPPQGHIATIDNIWSRSCIERVYVHGLITPPASKTSCACLCL